MSRYDYAKTRKLSGPDRLNILFDHYGLWELAQFMDYERDPTVGGRKNTHPLWMYALMEALIPEKGSLLQLVTDLHGADRRLWQDIKNAARRNLPDRPDLWPAEAPPTEGMYYYHLRENLLPWRERIQERIHKLACQIALGLGLAPPSSPSTDLVQLARTIVGDGKVFRARSKHNPDDPRHRHRRRLDVDTGELIDPRHDEDARLHGKGGQKNLAHGLKAVAALVRGEGRRFSIFTDIDMEEEGTTEQDIALNQFRRAKAAMPGLSAIAYDAAFQGKHNDQAMKELGVLALVRTYREDDGPATRFHSDHECRKRLP